MARFWLVLGSLLLVTAAVNAAHASNWAVLVCTSRYWFNYRHMANTLSMYRNVKRLGIPDSNIIMMIADEVACNPRNAHPGKIFDNAHSQVDLYGSSVEVDYRGYEVTVENFVRVLTGRHDIAVPRSKRMFPDKDSNVLVYLTGHGGNNFLKFQDDQELMAQDVADVVAQMHEKGRYKELLLVFETCQAATMYSRVHSPNVLAIASSVKGESSYSHHNDLELGVSVIDRFSNTTREFFEGVDIYSNATLANLMKKYTFQKLHSHFAFRKDLYNRDLNEVPVTDFFGSVSTVKATLKGYPIGPGREHPNNGHVSGHPVQPNRPETTRTTPTQQKIPSSTENDRVVVFGLLILLIAVGLSSRL